MAKVQSMEFSMEHLGQQYDKEWQCVNEKYKQAIHLYWKIISCNRNSASLVTYFKICDIYIFFLIYWKILLIAYAVGKLLSWLVR